MPPARKGWVGRVSDTHQMLPPEQGCSSPVHHGVKITTYIPAAAERVTGVDVLSHTQTSTK